MKIYSCYVQSNMMGIARALKIIAGLIMPVTRREFLGKAISAATPTVTSNATQSVIGILGQPSRREFLARCGEMLIRPPITIG